MSLKMVGSRKIGRAQDAFLLHDIATIKTKQRQCLCSYKTYECTTAIHREREYDARSWLSPLTAASSPH
jgi:hypothetical protein